MLRAAPEPPVWDFFLAHASVDGDRAQELYELLQGSSRVFLDKACLAPGDRWPDELLQAQCASRTTVALISGRDTGAYFAHEEIQRGIALHRAYPQAHRVIPVYLDGKPTIGEGIPYGLWLIQDLDVLRDGGMAGVAQRLRDALSLPASDEEATPGQERRFTHVLHAYPRGPLVEGYLVRSALIEAFAALIPPRRAPQVIEDANAFRREADPDDAEVTSIQRYDLPDPLATTARDFWMAAFDQARLHGPRMLAALVLTVPADLMRRESRDSREELLRQLRTDDEASRNPQTVM